MDNVKDFIEETVYSKGTDGVEEIINALTNTAYETAEHLRSDWQDEILAKEWEKFARKLDKIRGTLP